MSVDRDRIVAEFSRLRTGEDEETLAAAFGLPVSRVPADLWHGFAKRLLETVDGDLGDEAEELLVDAARESGYHLGYGILAWSASQETAGTRRGRTPRDVLAGACAAFAACGWPEAEIVDLVPGRRLLLRAPVHAETTPWEGMRLDRPRAALVRGMAAALMDLTFADQAYPDGSGAFCCLPTGTPGEFLVTPA